MFGDGDDEGDFGLDGFEDGGGGVGGGDEDRGRGWFVGVEGGEGAADGGVGGEVGEVRVGMWGCGCGLQGGGDAAEDLGAVGEGCEGVVGCLCGGGMGVSADAGSCDGGFDDGRVLRYVGAGERRWREGSWKNVLLCR